MNIAKKTSLTGIKPTGTPHLGNYLGAIRPALQLSEKFKSFYFIADYHALNAMYDPKALRESILKVAATWLALGLDPEKTIFYRQSLVPQIFELSWILSCYTPKGFMNRAHAYKDKVNKNVEIGEDPDHGVNMGLYSYPCLMNADILMFKAGIVPVGKDQKQHVEFARDIAIKFNSLYGKEAFVIPEADIRDETDIITGLDGRKMSKSYGNIIEIFLPSKELKKRVNTIVTNSQGVEEKKNPDICNVFNVFRHFASTEQIQQMREKYFQGGMGWGEAKKDLWEILETTFGEAREKYFYYLEHPTEVEAIVQAGSEKARQFSVGFLAEIRDIIGID